MKFINAIVLIFLLSPTGCKKEPIAPALMNDASSSGTATEAPTATVSQPLPAPPAYIAAQAENAIQANVVGQPDGFLTGQLRIFVKDKGRMPQSFTEFAGARLDSMPRAPEGSKWVIDSASAEVKLVKK